VWRLHCVGAETKARRRRRLLVPVATVPARRFGGSGKLCLLACGWHLVTPIHRVALSASTLCSVPSVDISHTHSRPPPAISIHPDPAAPSREYEELHLR
jgi:hypothetical protein